MAQWVRVLPVKHEGRSSNPHGACKKLGGSVCTWDPSIEGQRQTDPRSLLLSLAKMVTSRFPERPCLKALDKKTNEGRQPMSSAGLSASVLI